MVDWNDVEVTVQVQTVDALGGGVIGVTIGYLEPVSGNLLESPWRHLEKTAECVVNEIEIQPSYLGFEFERVMGG